MKTLWIYCYEMHIQTKSERKVIVGRLGPPVSLSETMRHSPPPLNHSQCGNGPLDNPTNNPGYLCG